MNHPLWTANQIAMAGKIRRHEGIVDLFVVEDLQGHPMAYTQNDRMARLYFAAPGMLNAMDRIAMLCSRIAESTVDLELKREMIDILDEINLALNAAIGVEIT